MLLKAKIGLNSSSPCTQWKHQSKSSNKTFGTLQYNSRSKLTTSKPSKKQPNILELINPPVSKVTQQYFSIRFGWTNSLTLFSKNSSDEIKTKQSRLIQNKWCGFLLDYSNYSNYNFSLEIISTYLDSLIWAYEPIWESLCKQFITCP